jgi:hypothetical protein
MFPICVRHHPPAAVMSNAPPLKDSSLLAKFGA